MPNSIPRASARFASAALAVALLSPVAALAGQCAEKDRLAVARQIEEAPDIGVEREIVGTVDLTGWREMGQFMLRMRVLKVAKGGVVPTHWHNDRPSIVHVVSGEIIEHSSFCAMPIVHEAGDTSPEFGDFHGHWWENKTDQEVVLISTDVVPFEMRDDKHM